MKSRAVQDQQMEGLIGWVLRIGVTLAAAIVAIGGVVYLCRRGTSTPDYHIFRPATNPNLTSVLQGAKRFDGVAIIEIGILVLIATPVARVALMLIAFLKERDLLYVAFSSIVLVVLAYSMLS